MGILSITNVYKSSSRQDIFWTSSAFIGKYTYEQSKYKRNYAKNYDKTKYLMRYWHYLIFIYLFVLFLFLKWFWWTNKNKLIIVFLETMWLNDYSLNQ